MEQPLLHLGRSCFRRLLVWTLLVLGAWLTLGCGATLKERTVRDITVLETSPSRLDTDEALAGLATAAPRGLIWIESDVYDANLVARDLERIERFYRAHGYYDVKVVAARVETVAERQVEIEVLVTPGPRVFVRKVEFEPPLSTLPPDAVAKIYKLKKLSGGEAFDEAALDKQKRDIETTLKETGFAYVKVRVRAKVDLNTRSADVVTETQLGRRARFGEIRIVGLKSIPESKVRAALGLRRGAIYSEAEQEDARQALADMGLFGRVDVVPDLSNPDVEDVPILVTLQEDKLRQLTLGGGTVLDSLKWEVHLRSGWEHKNFLGGARRFSVDGAGGVDFFPTRFESFKTLGSLTNAFPVVTTTARLEQPALFGGRTKGSAQAKFTVKPVLYSLPEGSVAEKEVVPGYATPSGKLALERWFVGQRIFLEPSYNLEARVPFFYQNSNGVNLQTVWVSYPRLYALFQTKTGDIFDDASKRELALSFRNSIELAGLKVGGTRFFGGSLSDVKIEPELRGVAPIWAKRSQDGQKVGNLLIAGRVKVGFILVPDYGSTLRSGQATTEQGISGDDAVSDQQKLLTRAFYSGGSTSNRGYAASAISPHGPVGLLLPTSVDCVANPALQACIRPLGGFTVWEASLELRFAGLYPITIVAFADASDVTRDIGAIKFKYPHLSVGPGLRYESPVGPLRLDVGIRVPGFQAIGQSELPLDHSHGQERPDLGLFPGAVVLAFGDAF